MFCLKIFHGLPFTGVAEVARERSGSGVVGVDPYGFVESGLAVGEAHRLACENVSRGLSVGDVFCVDYGLVRGFCDDLVMVALSAGACVEHVYVDEFPSGFSGGVLPSRLVRKVARRGWDRSLNRLRRVDFRSFLVDPLLEEFNELAGFTGCPVCVVDVDGCLANVSGLAKACFGEGFKDYESFYSGIVGCEPRWDVVEQVEGFRASHDLVVLTARVFTPGLFDFLARTGLGFSRVICRPRGLMQSGVGFKAEVLCSLRAEGLRVSAGFDDKREVCDMFGVAGVDAILV